MEALVRTRFHNLGALDQNFRSTLEEDLDLGSTLDSRSDTAAEACVLQDVTCLIFVLRGVLLGECRVTPLQKRFVAVYWCPGRPRPVIGSGRLVVFDFSFHVLLIHDSRVRYLQGKPRAVRGSHTNPRPLATSGG